MKIRIFLPLLGFVVVANPLYATVTIDWVTVGDAGNAAQSAANRMHSNLIGDGFGAVDYEYRISRNETTISQYAEFLNATAASDPYGLYSTNMATNLNIAGITRSGSSGSYSYSVIGSGDRPITYVSWFDAARFANWLHNGQGSGSTETGAYNLNGATSGVFTAQPGAKFRLPTENEWFKAAYYDPTQNGGTGGYWLHANQSNTMTSNDLADPGAANYRVGDYATTPGSNTNSSTTNYLTEVGVYGIDSQSYYGTNDQAGSVKEMVHTIFQSEPIGLRGGSWVSSSASVLASSNRESMDIELLDRGFRLASIPEPSSSLLGLMTAVAAVFHRRRA